MNRMIMNFEAVVHTMCGPGDEYVHEVQLMVNGHVVYRWTLNNWDAHQVVDRGHLQQVVSAKIYELLHPTQ